MLIETRSKPASAVGNIGVVSLLPEPDIVDEVLITTGPFKLSGGPQTEYVRQMEMLKETFLTAVWTQRSDRLQVGQEVLSRADYPGLRRNVWDWSSDRLTGRYRRSRPVAGSGL
jgi:hypothetical protein